MREFVLVVDEEQVCLDKPYDLNFDDLPALVIFRIPVVSANFFQIESFATWYQTRVARLKRYAESQNLRYADLPLWFSVIVGSKTRVFEHIEVRLKETAPELWRSNVSLCVLSGSPG